MNNQGLDNNANRRYPFTSDCAVEYVDEYDTVLGSVPDNVLVEALFTVAKQIPGAIVNVYC